MSRRNGLRDTRNGLTTAIDPATTAIINVAAPISSPTAKEPDPILTAAYVLNISGAPLPKARKVTPTTDSASPSKLAIVDRFGHRKS
ncbi:hypothetical protein AWJ20_733 [Sugiyamaella lignohabitans]|uniref:Uncharacterized protein n=1 Tax=Sugiyamaella lignohabitans TaxID=796027 RepID=A0A161HKU0_9ASCO|nr:uncharacterized protein AWJ20_733 [Sugiyamaella lignohabitans]ANB12478.1 hypothetical protein AWJ20_733 [Sugiyamaella lignohabitans]